MSTTHAERRWTNGGHEKAAPGAVGRYPDAAGYPQVADQGVTEMHDRTAAHLSRVPSGGGAVNVFRLLSERKAAERRSHRARTRLTRRAALAALVDVKRALAAYGAEVR